MNTDERTRRTERLHDFIRTMTEQYPQRNIGGVGSRPAADKIASLLHTALGQKATVAEEIFSCRPDGFLGWIKPAVLCYMLGGILCWTGYLTAAGLALTVPGLLTVLRLICYCPATDVFFPRRQGYNVVGVLEPQEEVQRQIILCGHHDAAHIFNFLEYCPRAYPWLARAAMALGLTAWSGTWLAVFQVASFEFAAIAVGLGAVAILPLWFFVSSRITPGAGDNLAGTGLVLATAEFYGEAARSGQGLRHTRLIFLSCDGEECGLAGSRAWIASHRAELNVVPTEAIVIDTIYSADGLALLERDLNGLVPLDRALTARLRQLAQGKGYPVRLAGLPLGGGATDAAAFARAGIPATCILDQAFDRITADWPYHTSRDTADKVSVAALGRFLAVLVDYLRQRDKICRTA